MLKLLPILIFILFSGLASAKDNNDLVSFYKTGTTWLSTTEELEAFKEVKFETIIKPDRFHEVSIQRLSDAITLLADDTFLKIPHDIATDYTSGHFKLEKGKRPYLVRAVSPGGQGHLSVGWNNKKRILSIIHTRMGDNIVPSVLTVPLVINLETAPKLVLVSVGAIK